MSQVVCIYDGPWFDRYDVEYSGTTPVRGQVYTIVGHRDFYGFKYYVLAEMPPPWIWQSDYFKPVKKTDISHFTGMLKTKKLEDA